MWICLLKLCWSVVSIQAIRDSSQTEHTWMQKPEVPFCLLFLPQPPPMLLFVCSFVSLISANSIHSFLHGSNQTALPYPSCLTASTGHRETHCLSIATRHRTEHPHTMSQRGITRNAWLHQDSSWDGLRGGDLGGLWQEATLASTRLLEGTEQND